ncbi:5-hydroxytryptamine receptor 3A [Nerophis lumbriciformis]|uniref:5-hydroxytryptamine receptor 3A n=1 Tax=Nerophis lumbriciformis TaxID=546530 RepID=UPI002ADF475E|nr:5-hydroxytryptamine receptor 3A-like [Nerophis lumbriciformis]
MSAWRTLALLAFTGSCAAASDCSYSSLLSHLNLSTSNDLLTIMRPVRNWTTVSVVRLDILLYGILEVNEKFQTLTSHVWMQMVWNNEYLTWNPVQFCGINKLTVPKSMLWIPDIVIEEDASDSGSMKVSPYVTLHFNGLMQIYTRQRLTSTCTLNLFSFPFDKQSCNISFRSMNHDKNTVTLVTLRADDFVTDVPEQQLVTKGEWTLQAVESEQNGTQFSNRDILVFQVKIARKPMLYVIIFIIPILCLLLLDLASFFISEARGEKMSFKITVLLSISVLLLILKDMLPSTEENLPLIASYCIGVFALVGFSVLEAMLMSFLIDLDNKCAKTYNSRMNTPVAVEQQKDDLKLTEHDLIKLVLQEVRSSAQEAGKGGAVEPKQSCYRTVVNIIDGVYFCCYVCTVGIFVVVMYTTWVPKDFFD